MAFVLSLLVACSFFSQVQAKQIDVGDSGIDHYGWRYGVSFPDQIAAAVGDLLGKFTVSDLKIDMPYSRVSFYHV